MSSHSSRSFDGGAHLLVNSDREESEKSLVSGRSSGSTPKSKKSHPAIDSESCQSLEMESSNKNKPDEDQGSYFNAFFGTIMMLLGVILVSLSTVFCKLAYMNNPNLTGFDYLIVRSTILTLCALIQAFSQQVNLLKIKKEGRFLLFLRCFFGLLFFPMFYSSLKFLPSSKATLISNMYPLFVTL